MKLVLIHARAKIVELARYPSFLVPTLLFPTAFYLAFGAVDDARGNQVAASFMAFAVLGVVFFMFGVGIAAERESPWEVFLRVLPVGVVTRLAARLLAALPFALASAAGVAVAATLTSSLNLPARRWLELVFVIAVGALPFGLLGIAIGYWCTPRGALPLANALYLGLAYVGGLWLAPDRLAGPIAQVSPFVPTRQWAELVSASVAGEQPAVWDWLGLALWGAAFAALAVWGYRRDEGRRYR